MATNNTLPTRVLGGHKAALKNPNVSDEAKEHSQQVINELEGSDDVQEVQDGYAAEEGKDEVRVNAGYKATLKNPNVSEEAKEHARAVLEEKGAI